MNKVAWWQPVLVGALLGFGAAMGVTCFCLVSEMSINLAKYLRRLADRLDRHVEADHEND